MAAPWIAFVAQPPAGETPTRAVDSRRRRTFAQSREDLDVLRDVRRRRGPFPSAGQRPDRHAPGDLTIAHRTSPTNIGLGLLATLAAHDLEFIDTSRARAADRRDPHDRRAARTIRRASAQLVRHAHAGAAASGVCVDRGQRQSGGRPVDALGTVSASSRRTSQHGRTASSTQ